MRPQEMNDFATYRILAKDSRGTEVVIGHISHFLYLDGSSLGIESVLYTPESEAQKEIVETFSINQFREAREWFNRTGLPFRLEEILPDGPLPEVRNEEETPLWDPRDVD